MDLSEFKRLRLHPQLEILKEEAESLANEFDQERYHNFLTMLELLDISDTTDVAGALQLVAELGRGGNDLSQEQAHLLPHFVRAIRNSVCKELVGGNWAA